MTTTVVSAQSKPNSQQELDHALPKILENAAQIGNAGIVMKDGEIIAQGKSGLRQKNGENQVGPNDKWHIGSITKSFTATMIGRLVDRGVLRFDDTIATLLPEHLSSIHKDWHTVTLIQFLTHTSGVKANFGMTVMLNRSFNNQAALDEARLKAVLGILAKPPANTPNTKFEYSNIGFTIVGTIAAHITGKSYEKLMKEEIFDPLGLESAGFGAPHGDAPWGHQTKLFILTSPVDPSTPESDNTPIIAPAGTAHMTLADLATYANTHLQAYKGNSSFLSKETASRLHTPAEVTKDKENYAGGWAIISIADDSNVIFHNGSNTMWYAFLAISPATNKTVAFATNSGTIQRSEQAFFELSQKLLSIEN